MAFESLLRLFVAWDENSDIFPHPDERSSAEEPINIQDIIKRNIGVDATFSESFYDKSTISEINSRPFEDREENHRGIEDIASNIKNFITDGNVDIAQRNETRGVQQSDVMIRVVNNHQNVPSLQWRSDREITYADPVAAHGNVYGLNDNIIAFSEENGGINWEYKPDESVTKTPTTTKNAVLVQDGSQVVSLSPDDGSVKWDLDCGVQLGTASRFEVINDNVYFGTTGGELYRFSTKGNQLECIFKSDQHASFSTVPHAHGLFFVNGSARSLEDGSEIWTYPESGDIDRLIGSSENLVYIWNNPIPGAWTLYAIDSETGEIDWRIEDDGVGVRVKYVPKHNQTYIGANESILAVDQETGDIQWERELEKLADAESSNNPSGHREPPANLNYRNISILDDKFIIIFNEGIAAIKQNGDVTWWYIFPHQSVEPNGVCDTDDTLWVTTEFGDIYAVDVANGEEVARYESASPISRPRIRNNYLIATLKTYEYQYFDGHKQRIKNKGELVVLNLD